MESTSPNVWVVLPTYNEAGNLERMLRAIISLGLGLQIVVVDDGSPDGTGAIADAMARTCAHVHVIHRADERGLGTAYIAGFTFAAQRGAEAVLTMDCDFSHDPAVIPLLLQASAGADVVIGSRYTRGGSIRNWPPYRKHLSASANRFVRILFRMPVRDCTSGFRLYQHDVLQAIPWKQVRSTGYSFLVETLYRAVRQEGVRVKEVPICFADRQVGESKMGLKEVVRGIASLLRIRIELRRSKHLPPVNDCAPAAPVIRK